MAQVTNKMVRFVEEFVSLGNASEAYRRAYAPDEASLSCGNRAYDLQQVPAIAAMIAEKRKEASDRAKFSVDNALELLRKIIDADPAEMIAIRRGACRHCWGDDHKYQWREPDFWEAMTDAEAEAAVSLARGRDPKSRAAARLPDLAGGFGYNATKPPHEDCPKCDGQGLQRTHAPDTRYLSEGARLAYQGVKETRSGIEILMMTREKALDLYGKFAGWSNDPNLRLGDIGAMLVETARIAAMDPNEASRAYRAMKDATG